MIGGSFVLAILKALDLVTTLEGGGVVGFLGGVKTAKAVRVCLVFLSVILTVVVHVG